LTRKNEDSKKSDSATKMLTSFPCILIASLLMGAVYGSAIAMHM
jgi:hypothetical protein